MSAERLTDEQVAAIAKWTPTPRAAWGPYVQAISLAQEVQVSRVRIADLEAKLATLADLFHDLEWKVTRWDEPFEGWQASLHGPFCPCRRCGVPETDMCHDGSCDPNNLTDEQADVIEELLDQVRAIVERQP